MRGEQGRGWALLVGHAEAKALTEPWVRCHAVSMRISVFTPGENDQGDWEVDAYSIEGGAIRLFSESDGEIAAYSPTGWTHMRVLER